MTLRKSMSEEEAVGVARLSIGAVEEWDYETVLERIGFGKMQWLLLLISGLLTITSMAGIRSAGIIAIAAQCEFEMTLSQKGVLIVASTAGVFISTYFWGYLSDAYGRRNVLLKGMLASNLIQFLTVFITNIWVYNFLNLLMGVSVGSISAALYAYLSEVTEAKHRAVMINYSTMFVSVTSIYVPAVAWPILSQDWALVVTKDFILQPWRLLIIFTLLPGFIGALILLPLPESPKFLLAQQRDAEALAAMERICKYNTGRSLASLLKSNVQCLKADAQDVEIVHAAGGICGILQHLWKSTVPLFQAPHGVNFIISAVVVLSFFFSCSGVEAWFPEIVNRLSSSATFGQKPVCSILDTSFELQAMDQDDTHTDMCDDSIATKTYVDTIIVGVVFLIGFIVQGMLLRPLGRKNVLYMAMGIAILSGICLHFVKNATLQLVCFCLYILMPGLSISVILGALVDFVPTQLRGKAVSIALTGGRLGIVIASNVMGAMLEPLCNATFAIFTCTMLIGTFLVRFLPFK